jgi:hemoglobin
MKISNVCKLAWVALALLHGAASAQDSYTPKTPADDSLYQAFGARAGLVKLMDDFVPRLLADARMQPFFADVDLPKLKEQLVTQVCQVAGGPCRREGPGMKTAHDGMDIRKHDFNALVEVLQLSMDAQGIPFGVQNRLLAQLAPMHRDIVNTP